MLARSYKSLDPDVQRRAWLVEDGLSAERAANSWYSERKPRRAKQLDVEPSFPPRSDSALDQCVSDLPAAFTLQSAPVIPDLDRSGRTACADRSQRARMLRNPSGPPVRGASPHLKTSTYFESSAWGHGRLVDPPEWAAPKVGPDPPTRPTSPAGDFGL